MCGICGVLDFNNNAQKWHNQLLKSNELLRHRGPNSSGIFIHNNVGLAHTRLSVIDTSNNGNQPLADYSDNYVIVFNGELYDYKTHRKDLENKGYKFKSDSDTEVLLNLFIEHGESFLNLINGCFALAIYNKANNSLLIARDRFGIKPLVYYSDYNMFVFASEIKAVLPFGINKKINDEALNLYLHLNYIPAPLTIFENVYKLKPGHYVKITCNKFETVQYYKTKITTNNKISFDEASEHLNVLLNNSVKQRLISDVPIGTFLSGGIDSSIITAVASEYTSKLNTFSMGFENESLYDETKYAKIIADKYNTLHNVVTVSKNDLLNEVYDVLGNMDEPFADSSAVAVSAISKYTKKYVTVALSGDGADEIHAGYNKHYAHYLAQKNSFKNKIISGFNPLFSLLPKSRNIKFSNKFRQLEKYSTGITKDNNSRYWYWCGFANNNYSNKILLNSNNYSDFKFYENITNDFNTILLADVNLVLPNDMLFKVDIFSMLHGLEVRVPMLDHNIVDFMFTLPADFKINNKVQKNLLKHAFKNYLPEQIINKPKHGFEIPVRTWLKNELKPLIDHYLNKENINKQNIFNSSEIEKIKNKLYQFNTKDSPNTLWNLLVFEYWYEKYFS